MPKITSKQIEKDWPLKTPMKNTKRKSKTEQHVKHKKANPRVLPRRKLRKKI